MVIERRIGIVIVLFAAVMTGCREDNAPDGILLNDVHSQLNPTRVAEVVYPETTADIVNAIKRSRRQGRAVSISGGRHAMGGQPFGEDTLHISMSRMNDILDFDHEQGIVRVEAGITWPQLIDGLRSRQETGGPQWGIIQKQTGADHLSLGGALSANAHGRGVRFKPLIQDVEAFTLVDAQGRVLPVSRRENGELFSLVIGGYGLFGVIATIDLRLQPRIKLQRNVEVIPIGELPDKTKQRLEEGYLYGDFQYKTDEQAADFMQVGVFSTYRPVSSQTPVAEQKKRLTAEKWHQLILLAHTDKEKAFASYSNYYLSTHGQIYWSDTHQLSYYDDGYEEYLKETMPDYRKGSLMITEVYVPRSKLNDFIEKVRSDALEHRVDIIYGTMRLIERDDESFLAWAKDSYACVIFNLRVDHTNEGLAKAQRDFQRLIDRALKFGGSYFLTYHRWARKDQVLAAYPQFPGFLRLKRRYDPEERFQSEWYRHYREMFAEELGD